MATFTLSLPDADTDLIDRVAHENERSRAAQVRIIIADWLAKQRGEVKPE